MNSKDTEPGPDPDPDSDFYPFRIPDPGVNKALDPDPDPQHWPHTLVSMMLGRKMVAMALKSP